MRVNEDMGKRKRATSNGDGNKDDDTNILSPSEDTAEEDAYPSISLPPRRCRQTTVSQQDDGTPKSTSKTRTLKKSKKEATSPTCKKDDKEEEVQVKRQKRAWEVWSSEEKQAFFEALKEHGKDFEAIRKYLVGKLKRKDVKNKNQVRHFYYRTWHKISKYLDISADVKKGTCELYGLVNYGELRKKVKGRLDEKVGVKLNELVHKGITSCRIRGKNIRIKTPPCKALKILNKIEEPQEDPLPARLLVELLPASNRSWDLVQAVAQNPRLRLEVGLQYRMANIFVFLQKKWRPFRHKYQDRMVVDGERDPERSLRLYTRRRCDNELTFETSELLKSSEVCLEKYAQKFSLDEQSGAGLSTPTKADSKKSTNNNSGITQDSVPIASDVPKDSDGQTTEGEDTGKDSGVSDMEKEDDAATIKEEPQCDLALLQLKALETIANPVNHDPDVNIIGERTLLASNLCTEVACSVPDKDPSASILCTEVACSVPDKDPSVVGWTRDDCASITIGELYLRMGRPEKIEFWYEWEPIEKDFKQDLTSLLTTLLTAAKSFQSDSTKAKLQSSAGSSRVTKIEQGVQVPPEVTVMPPPTAVQTYNQNRPVRTRPFNDNIMKNIPVRKPARRQKNMPQKNVVVQRMLPLLPRGAHKIPISRNSRSFIQFHRPVQTVNAIAIGQSSIPVTLQVPQISIPEVELLPQPPNLSNILEISLPSSDTANLESITLSDSAVATSDKFMDLSLDNSNFAGLLGSDKSNTGLVASSLHGLNDDSNQWLNGEVNDFSLSSLLGNLESPMKACNTSSATSMLPHDESTQMGFLSSN